MSACAGRGTDSAAVGVDAPEPPAVGGVLGNRITEVSGASMRRKTGATGRTSFFSPASRGTASDSAGPAAVAARSPSAITKPVRCQSIFAPPAGNSPQREM